MTSASVQDRDGAVTLLASLYLLFGMLQIIWADGGYAGALVAWVKGLRPFGKLHLDIVRRSDDAKGFQLVRKRWIVERTFAWLYKSRRLSHDYEKRVDHSESHIYVCMCHLMLKRLTKTSPVRLSGYVLRNKDEKAHEVLAFRSGGPQLHKVLPQSFPLRTFPALEPLEHWHDILVLLGKDLSKVCAIWFHRSFGCRFVGLWMTEKIE